MKILVGFCEQSKQVKYRQAGDLGPVTRAKGTMGLMGLAWWYAEAAWESEDDTAVQIQTIIPRKKVIEILQSVHDQSSV